MFTGIITDTARVLKTEPQDGGLDLDIVRPDGWAELVEGESINTDGVCLTISLLTSASFQCHLVPETLRKTTFGKQVPETVNLERSLQASDRFGGHFVQGHVDEVGTVTEIKEGNDRLVQITYSPSNGALVVPKGAITINGVSLTVVDVSAKSFSVALIPYTTKHTTLGKLKVGDKVNLEFDMIGKYIVKGLKLYANS